MKTRKRVGLYLLSTTFLVPLVFSQEVKVSATLDPCNHSRRACCSLRFAFKRRTVQGLIWGIIEHKEFSLKYGARRLKQAS